MFLSLTLLMCVAHFMTHKKWKSKTAIEWSTKFYSAILNYWSISSFFRNGRIWYGRIRGRRRAPKCHRFCRVWTALFHWLVDCHRCCGSMQCYCQSRGLSHTNFEGIKLMFVAWNVQLLPHLRSNRNPFVLHDQHGFKLSPHWWQHVWRREYRQLLSIEHLKRLSYFPIRKWSC